MGIEAAIQKAGDLKPDFIPFECLPESLLKLIFGRVAEYHMDSDKVNGRCADRHLMKFKMHCFSRLECVRFGAFLKNKCYFILYTVPSIITFGFQAQCSNGFYHASVV